MNLPVPTIRQASLADMGAMHALIERSVMRLMEPDYSFEQRRRSIGPLFGVDTQIIGDGTYYAVEADGKLVGCGGWSFRRTLFGGDGVQGRDNARADPNTDPARLRAFYVEPDCARQGIATLILEASEAAAKACGFRTMELGATLTGERFYLRRGYRPGHPIPFNLPGGVGFFLVHMEKMIG